jgi:hypothetical protein
VRRRSQRSKKVTNADSSPAKSLKGNGLSEAKKTVAKKKKTPHG